MTLVYLSMPTLSWNEIRLRAARFSGEWTGATSERGDAQSFWDQFFAWMRATCGRLESRYRYSNTIVYNNFPWPSSPSDGTTSHSTKPASGQVAGYPQPSPVKGEGVVAPLSPRGRGAGGEGDLEAAAQAVLDARAQHPQSTLADLYNPNTMPDDLRAAHKALDKAVDAAYLADGGQKKWADDSERVAFLFRRYEALTSLLAGR